MDYDETPLCVIGHCAFASRSDTDERGEMLGPLMRAFRPSGGVVTANDEAVGVGRIPFDEWCRRLNVVRGK